MNNTDVSAAELREMYLELVKRSAPVGVLERRDPAPLVEGVLAAAEWQRPAQAPDPVH